MLRAETNLFNHLVSPKLAPQMHNTSYQRSSMKLQFAALLIVASGSVGYAQTSNTWTGFVIDTHCGTHCQRTSAMNPDRTCVQRCVKQGSKYGLWSGNHVYTLEPQSKVSNFAAENVSVTGSLANDTIHIDSITRIPDERHK
jgi:hypothetical protein